MVIEIRKVGPTKFSNYAIFNCVFDNGFVINGIATYKDLDLKAGTTYKDLYLYCRTNNGITKYYLYKK